MIKLVLDRNQLVLMHRAHVQSLWLAQNRDVSLLLAVLSSKVAAAVLAAAILSALAIRYQDEDKLD